jgi:hypothetical protein
VRSRVVPGSVHVPWTDLLAKRALLHEHLGTFRGEEDFTAKATSSRVSDRRDAAALERFAEEVFNIYVDLSRELLGATNPDDHAALRNLPADAVLRQLREQGLISASVFEDMDSIREVRNSWQHGASFVPAVAVWRGVTETERTIDRALGALQRGFEREGYALDMDFPELKRD